MGTWASRVGFRFRVPRPHKYVFMAVIMVLEQ